MDFRTPVDAIALARLGKPEHRGEGSDSEADIVLAQVQLAVDVHHHGCGARHDELVGADDARPFEQCMDRDIVAFLRPDPEFREIRELLLATALPCIERNAACGKPVLPQFADGAEIGSAEKGDPVVLVPVERPVLGLLQAEAGKADALRQLARGRVRGHVEIGLVVEDFARLPAFDEMDLDRLAEELAEMEEGHRALLRPGRIDRRPVIVADLAPFLVVQLLHDLRGRLRRRLVGDLGEPRGLGLQRVEGEGLGRPELQLRPLRRRERQCRGDAGGPCGAQNLATVDLAHGVPRIMRARLALPES